MARNAEVRVDFKGDATQLNRAFDSVGASAEEMARDVDKQSRKMSDSMDGAGHKIAGGIDESESKFRGLGDTIGGTGDIMQGFKDGNVVSMAMGFADLAGGITEFVVPALLTMKSTLLTALAPALTAISAHPLIAGILIGGAIIAGLILLEKKFGIVSGSVNWLKEHAIDPLWESFKGILSWFTDTGQKLADVILWPYKTAFHAIATLWNNTVGRLSFEVPSWVPGIGGKSWDIPDLPTFHDGGVIPGVPGQAVPILAMAGETVTPAGRGGGTNVYITVSGVGMGRDFGRAVADALRQNGLIGVT